jgi:hypothetical protein
MYGYKALDPSIGRFSTVRESDHEDYNVDAAHLVL